MSMYVVTTYSSSTTLISSNEETVLGKERATPTQLGLSATLLRAAGYR
jgi:hypothetical protein